MRFSRPIATAAEAPNEIMPSPNRPASRGPDAELKTATRMSSLLGERRQVQVRLVQPPRRVLRRVGDRARVGEQQGHRLEALLHRLPRVHGVEAHHRVVERQGPRADAEHQPAAGQVIEPG
ncbi:hypothetical protein GCM10025868_26610 [Angustibacter aerolatus]|uniref:Uncharacterized protein n=1 Tax=Angustibacter aerolatus TaxID=1162965 RepID=A0ABQ6JKT5_9ACTN|nr:hypothetical protein GCM10025868_26610 [Angustibacter aerolatus]